MTRKLRPTFRALDDETLDATNGGWAQFIPVIVRTLGTIGGNPGGQMRDFGALDYAGKAWDAAKDYFNPSPGQGAPGDTYHPATANPDGSINPGHFEAPPRDPNLPQVPMSSDAGPAPAAADNQFASATPSETSTPTGNPNYADNQSYNENQNFADNQNYGSENQSSGDNQQFAENVDAGSDFA